MVPLYGTTASPTSWPWKTDGARPLKTTNLFLTLGTVKVPNSPTAVTPAVANQTEHSMSPVRRFPSKPALCLSATLAASLVAPGLSASPEWVPVAELLLGSMGNSDAHQMAEVMNRCTALNMTLSALVANDSPEVSKGYENQALQLIQNGIIIEMNTEKLRTGVEPDLELLSGNALDAVKGMLGTYNAWLEENFSAGGSYFTNDFEIEMKGCELATKFVLQMSAR